MKKIISLSLILVLGLIVLTGCEGENKNNGVEISYTHGKGIITVTVPQDKKGNPKYKFTTKKPNGISVTKTFYLVTDKAMVGFGTTGMSYNTSAKYKEKYKDKEASFDNYLEFIEDKDLFNKSYLPGFKLLEINGRKALRYYNRSGGSGNYKYLGYFYSIGVDDIYKGSKLDLVVNYKDSEKPEEEQEIDKETLEIIESIKVTENK